MLRFPLAMELSAFLPVECPLTRAEYDDLVRRGVLDEANVELLHGRIVSMSPHGKGHRIGVRGRSGVLDRRRRARGRRGLLDPEPAWVRELYASLARCVDPRPRVPGRPGTRGRHPSSAPPLGRRRVTAPAP